MFLACSRNRARALNMDGARYVIWIKTLINYSFKTNKKTSALKKPCQKSGVAKRARMYVHRASLNLGDRERVFLKVPISNLRHFFSKNHHELPSGLQEHMTLWKIQGGGAVSLKGQRFLAGHSNFVERRLYLLLYRQGSHSMKEKLTSALFKKCDCSVSLPRNLPQLETGFLTCQQQGWT